MEIGHDNPMSDSRPLRQEDYLAMAEELRQLQAEMIKLKTPSKAWGMVKKCFKATLHAVFRKKAIISYCVVAISLIVASITYLMLPPHDQGNGQTYPCYYPMRSNFDWFYWDIVGYDEIILVNTNKQFLFQMAITTIAVTLKLKTSAWEYLRKHRLNVCNRK